MKNKLMAGIIAAAAAATLLTAARAQSAAFRFFGPLSRVITPNGDGINDLSLICFDNPQDSDVSGRIYTLLGAEVQALTARQPVTVGNVPCPGGAVAPSQYLSWDGRSGGTPVRSGVYIYRIQAEKRIYAGTFLVVR